MDLCPLLYHSLWTDNHTYNGVVINRGARYSAIKEIAFPILSCWTTGLFLCIVAGPRVNLLSHAVAKWNKLTRGQQGDIQSIYLKYNCNWWTFGAHHFCNMYMMCEVSEWWVNQAKFSLLYIYQTSTKNLQSLNIAHKPHWILWELDLVFSFGLFKVNLQAFWKKWICEHKQLGTVHVPMQTRS